MGKLYSLAAGRIAASIAAEVDGVADAQCVLVSQIGRPVSDPWIVDLELGCEAEDPAPPVRAAAASRLRAALDALPELREDLLAGRVTVF